MPKRDPLADPLPMLQRVHAYVMYRIGPGPDAEDITSEAFARAVRYRDRFDPAKGDPLAWLIGIARRCIDDALTDRGRPVPAPEPEEFRDLEHETVERLVLAAAIRRLPPRDRDLIALRYGAGLNPAEIGAQLQLRRNAVDVALHRALARLRLLLEAGETRGKNHASEEVFRLSRPNRAEEAT